MPNKKKLLVMFPGQGSQKIGMGRDFFDQSKIVQDYYATASEICGVDIQKLCFDGPIEELTLTENLQPSLLTACMAYWENLKPNLNEYELHFAGHSLGEYAALVAAGKVDFQKAVSLVRARGKAMQSAVPVGEGAMAAVLTTEQDHVIEVCNSISQEFKEACSPANYNSSSQLVIAGSKKTVTEAVDRLKAQKIRAIPLKVSAPFHCSLMKPARDRMKSLLEDTQITSNSIKVAANVSAKFQSEYSSEYLIEQIDQPVLWAQTIQNAIENDVTHFVECGPGTALSGMLKRDKLSVEILSYDELCSTND